MDMKHLGESATYEDAWKADEAAKPEAGDEFEPKADEASASEPEVQAAGKQDSGAETAPVPDAQVEAHDEYAAGFGMDMPKSEAPAAVKHQPQSFAEAFAMHRKAGAKTFDWQGKSYTTKLASDKPAAKVAAKPAAPAAKPAADKPAFNKFAKTGADKGAPSYGEFAEKRDAAEAPKIVRSSNIGEPKPEPKPDGSLMKRVAGEADALMGDAAKPIAGGEYPKAKAKPDFDDGKRFAGVTLK